MRQTTAVDVRARKIVKTDGDANLAAIQGSATADRATRPRGRHAGGSVDTRGGRRQRHGNSTGSPYMRVNCTTDRRGDLSAWKQANRLSPLSAVGERPRRSSPTDHRHTLALSNARAVRSESDSATHCTRLTIYA